MRDNTAKLVTLIKNERLAAKITQGKMAAELCVHVRTYIRMEKGDISLNEAFKILAYLGYEISVYKKGSITNL